VGESKISVRSFRVTHPSRPLIDGVHLSRKAVGEGREQVGVLIRSIGQSTAIGNEPQRQ
jgi:hypothetical protein